MASKSTTASFSLFLVLNVLFFTFSSACYTCPPEKKTTPPPPSSGNTPCPPPPAAPAKCPADTLKLGVCANLLNGLINVTLGNPPKEPCCSLLEGLVDLEAAVCLCTVLKASILGINLNLPIDLSLVLNYCGKGVPAGFQCY